MNFDFIYSAINKQLELTYSSENLNSVLTKSKFLYNGEFYSIEEYEKFKFWFLEEYKSNHSLPNLPTDDDAARALMKFNLKFGFRVRGEEFEFNEDDFES